VRLRRIPKYLVSIKHIAYQPRKLGLFAKMRHLIYPEIKVCSMLTARFQSGKLRTVISEAGCINLDGIA
jgi:hypothetical protein